MGRSARFDTAVIERRDQYKRCDSRGKSSIRKKLKGMEFDFHAFSVLLHQLNNWPIGAAHVQIRIVIDGHNTATLRGYPVADNLTLQAGRA